MKDRSYRITGNGIRIPHHHSKWCSSLSEDQPDSFLFPLSCHASPLLSMTLVRDIHLQPQGLPEVFSERPLETNILNGGDGDDR